MPTARKMPSVNAPQIIHAEMPKRNGFAPMVRSAENFTLVAIAKMPALKKILETSEKKLDVDVERVNALLMMTKRMKNAIKGGIRVFKESLAPSDLPRRLSKVRKMSNGASKTTRVSFETTAYLIVVPPTNPAVAMTCPTSCTAAPSHAPLV